MLNGRPVLIVEREFLIALDIQRMLEPLGAGQTLFARNTEEARQLGARWPELALAIVEIQIEDVSARALAAELAAASIPVIATSGDINMVRRIGTMPLTVILKPIPEEQLASAVALAVQP